MPAIPGMISEPPLFFKKLQPIGVGACVLWVPGELGFSGDWGLGWAGDAKEIEEKALTRRKRGVLDASRVRFESCPDLLEGWGGANVD